ncbi:cupin domain-containing protein [Mucilaginibacter lappiensis]|uniref:cupin domain-containing protein n=1 Tax=Mucilaginibacter lappiensis TaxID=354630 RepID=UPI003D214162
MKKFTLSLFVFCAVFAINAQAQHEPKSVNVTQFPPEVIFKKIITTPEIKSQEAKLVVVTFAPGEVSGAHRHPIPTIAYVLQGSISSTFNGKTHIYNQGEAFWEDPNGLHAESKNMSKTKQAKLLVYFIGPKELPFITEGK